MSASSLLEQVREGAGDGSAVGGRAPRAPGRHAGKGPGFGPSVPRVGGRKTDGEARAVFPLPPRRSLFKRTPVRPGLPPTAASPRQVGRRRGLGWVRLFLRSVRARSLPPFWPLHDFSLPLLFLLFLHAVVSPPLQRPKGQGTKVQNGSVHQKDGLNDDDIEPYLSPQARPERQGRVK
uniref:YTH N6-methyladenosine RNA binding protein 2 n=1 Tax=Varanus komodoensis TaxID=61221 RepID=A0A8D2J8V0_VARKO